MDKTIAEQCREKIRELAHGPTVRIPNDELRLLFINAADRLDKQDKALRAAADRFDDLGDFISEGKPYNNAGFFKASARRCRELDF